jgi:hypothetical protein
MLTAHYYRLPSVHMQVLLLAPKYGSFIAEKACVPRDIPWQTAVLTRAVKTRCVVCPVIVIISDCTFNPFIVIEFVIQYFNVEGDSY